MSYYNVPSSGAMTRKQAIHAWKNRVGIRGVSIREIAETSGLAGISWQGDHGETECLNFRDFSAADWRA